ncbi:MAG: MFS transporter [Desulfarculus sp.]|nr:MFS transporter [Pseudomonadota bacterium]MBU4596953.1 MFS transporter [Pseudomonadota bacterium]MBV1714296.1 MFS transporter [Desulfarculus sp.]MBV1737648.1 MFS transporter [Desulfarculus sp.]
MAPSERRSLRSRFAEHGWVVFTVLTLLFIFSYMVRLSTGVLGPMLIDDLNINAGQLGLLAGVFFYAFGAAQIPVGLALDSFGPKRTIIATSLLAVAGCILTGVGTSYSLVLVGRLLLGLGMSSVLMGSLKVFANWFRADRFAFLAGSILSLGNLGGLLAATPLLLMAMTLGWRNCFFYFAAFVLLIIFLIACLVSDHPPRIDAGQDAGPPPSGPRGWQGLAALGSIFLNWHFWIMGLGSFVRYGSMLTIHGFLGMLYLVEIVGLGPEEAGTVLGMISVGYLIGSPLAGRLSDTVLRSRKKVVTAGFFLFALNMIPFWFPASIPLPLWYILFGCIGLFSATSPVNFAHVKELFPPRMTGTVLTGANLFVMLGAALGSQLTGAFLELYPRSAAGYPSQAYLLVFLGLFAASMIAGLLYILVKDTHGVRNGQA